MLSRKISPPLAITRGTFMLQACLHWPSTPSVGWPKLLPRWRSSHLIKTRMGDLGTSFNLTDIFQIRWILRGQLSPFKRFSWVRCWARGCLFAGWQAREQASSRFWNGLTYFYLLE